MHLMLSYLNPDLFVQIARNKNQDTCRLPTYEIVNNKDTLNKLVITPYHIEPLLPPPRLYKTCLGPHIRMALCQVLLRFGMELAQLGFVVNVMHLPTAWWTDVEPFIQFLEANRKYNDDLVLHVWTEDKLPEHFLLHSLLCSFQFSAKVRKIIENYLQ